MVTDLFVEANLVANNETDIHRYSWLNKYPAMIISCIHAFIGSLGYNYKVPSM